MSKISKYPSVLTTLQHCRTFSGNIALKLAQVRKEEKTYYKTCVTEHTLTTFPYDIPVSQNLIGFMSSLENTHLVE